MTDNVSAKLDTSVPHSARVWNYWLGGKDNFRRTAPLATSSRNFTPTSPWSPDRRAGSSKRAVTFLAGEVGIRQFLDIGTGMPSADNTHQVAQSVAPDSRIVYVDNDPLVLVHARALLTGTPRARPSTSTPTCTTPGDPRGGEPDHARPLSADRTDPVQHPRPRPRPRRRGRHRSCALGRPPPRAATS